MTKDNQSPRRSGSVSKDASEFISSDRLARFATDRLGYGKSEVQRIQKDIQKIMAGKPVGNAF